MAFYKENLEGKIINLPFVRLKHHIDNILTKIVLSEALEEGLCKLGV